MAGFWETIDNARAAAVDWVYDQQEDPEGIWGNIAAYSGVADAIVAANEVGKGVHPGHEADWERAGKAAVLFTPAGKVLRGGKAVSRAVGTGMKKTGQGAVNVAKKPFTKTTPKTVKTPAGKPKKTKKEKKEKKDEGSKGPDTDVGPPKEPWHTFGTRGLRSGLKGENWFRLPFINQGLRKMIGHAPERWLKDFWMKNSHLTPEELQEKLDRELLEILPNFDPADVINRKPTLNQEDADQVDESIAKKGGPSLLNPSGTSGHERWLYNNLAPERRWGSAAALASGAQQMMTDPLTGNTTMIDPAGLRDEKGEFVDDHAAAIAEEANRQAAFYNPGNRGRFGSIHSTGSKARGNYQPATLNRQALSQFNRSLKAREKYARDLVAQEERETSPYFRKWKMDFLGDPNNANVWGGYLGMEKNAKGGYDFPEGSLGPAYDRRIENIFRNQNVARQERQYADKARYRASPQGKREAFWTTGSGADLLKSGRGSPNANPFEVTQPPLAPGFDPFAHAQNSPLPGRKVDIPNAVVVDQGNPSPFAPPPQMAKVDLGNPFTAAAGEYFTDENGNRLFQPADPTLPVREHPL